MRVLLNEIVKKTVRTNLQKLSLKNPIILDSFHAHLIKIINSLRYLIH
jgi:hypothetical protein